MKQSEAVIFFLKKCTPPNCTLETPNMGDGELLVGAKVGNFITELWIRAKVKKNKHLCYSLVTYSYHLADVPDHVARLQHCYF